MGIGFPSFSLWTGYRSRKLENSHSNAFLASRFFEENQQDLLKLKFTQKEINLLFILFLRLDKRRELKLTSQDLATHLKLGDSAFVARLLKVFQAEPYDSVDFFTFVITLWQYCTLDRASLIAFAFNLYKNKQNDCLSKADYKSLVFDSFGPENPENKYAENLLHGLDRVAGEKKFITLKEFQEFANRSPNMLLGAFTIQRQMQKRCLGVKFWGKQTEKCWELKQSGIIIDVQEMIKKHHKQRQEMDIQNFPLQDCAQPPVNSCRSQSFFCSMDAPAYGPSSNSGTPKNELEKTCRSARKSSMFESWSISHSRKQSMFESCEGKHDPLQNSTTLGSQQSVMLGTQPSSLPKKHLELYPSSPKRGVSDVCFNSTNIESRPVSLYQGASKCISGFKSHSFFLEKNSQDSSPGFAKQRNSDSNLNNSKPHSVACVQRSSESRSNSLAQASSGNHCVSLSTESSNNFCVPHPSSSEIHPVLNARGSKFKENFSLSPKLASPSVHNESSGVYEASQKGSSKTQVYFPKHSNIGIDSVSRSGALKRGSLEILANPKKANSGISAEISAINMKNENCETHSVSPKQLAGTPKRGSYESRSVSPKRESLEVGAASPKRGSYEARSVSPKRGSLEVGAGSPKRGSYEARSISPKRGSLEVGGVSPKTGSYEAHSVYPERGSLEVGAASPKKGSYEARSISPKYGSIEVGAASLNRGSNIGNFASPNRGSLEIVVSPPKRGSCEARSVSPKRNSLECFAVSPKRGSDGARSVSPKSGDYEPRFILPVGERRKVGVNTQRNCDLHSALSSPHQSSSKQLSAEPCVHFRRSSSFSGNMNLESIDGNSNIVRGQKSMPALLDQTSCLRYSVNLSTEAPS